MAKLIAYFSRAGENYFSGEIKSVKVGNTEIVAEALARLTGADIFKIEPLQPYSKSYNEYIAQAQDDQRRDARPELKSYPDNVTDYDTAFLGYPNYWGSMPMPVFTFLEHFNFDGKIIIPFCTHEGSGMGRSESDIKKLCPGAVVKKGLSIQGGCVANAEDKIKQFLKEV